MRGNWTKARYSRREVVLRAARAGIGAAALSAVGCTPPEVYNSRRQPVDEESAPAPPAAQGRQTATQPTVQPATRVPERQAAPAVGRAPDASGIEVRNCTRPSLAHGDLAVSVYGETAQRVIADPEVWRERFHWRTLPVQGDIAPADSHLTLNSNAAGTTSRYLKDLASSAWMPLLYSQLVVLAAGDGVDAHRAAIEGDLASSWETPDPATIAFTLRDGVRWPDRDGSPGRALTASDVAAAHEVHRNDGQAQSAVYRAVAGIEADDASGSVRFALSEPDASLLPSMTGSDHVILPPDWSPGRSSPPPGTGPFQVAEWNGPYELWRFTRSPDYFKRDAAGRPLPYLSGIRGGLPPDDSVSGDCPVPADAWSLWLGGGVDAAALRHPGEVVESLGSSLGAVAQVAAPRPGGGSAIEFPRNVERPVADPRVRRAISMAIDRRRLAEQWEDGLAAPDCGMNWTLAEDDRGGFREWPWTEAELGPSYRQDPEAVRALLDAAGYSRQSPLRLSMLPGSPELSVRSPEGFARTGQLASMLNAASAGMIRLEQWTAPIRLGEYENHFNAESGRRFLAVPGANLALSDSSLLHPAACDPTTLAPLPLVLHQQDTEDARIAELWRQQRRTVDPVERSRVLEQLRLRRAELMETVHLINRYGLFARLGSVRNLMLTAFAHDPLQQAKQFERTWKSGGA